MKNKAIGFVIGKAISCKMEVQESVGLIQVLSQLDLSLHFNTKEETMTLNYTKN